MNKKLMLAIAVVLSIPVVVFAQNAIQNQQRHKRYQLMQQTVGQVQGISSAIYRYSFDSKGKMPPMQNSTVLVNALKPFITKEQLISKSSGKPFVLNAKLSGKPLDKSNRIVWCYDAKPTPLNGSKDLYRVVGFSNSTIAMPEARWQREKKTSGLP